MKRLATILFLILVFSLEGQAQAIQARKGLLNLQQYDFERKGSIRLNGEWEFFMSELIPAQAFEHRLSRPPDYISFPSTWNHLSQSARPGQGYATFHLQVLVKSPQSFTLELPHCYSNYTLWINGVPLASNGVVGQSKETSVPQWLPQTTSFTAEKDTLHLVLHISNFHHAKGGIREPLLLGAEGDLLFKHELSTTSNIVLFIFLVIAGCTFLIISLFVRKEFSAIFFAAMCLTWAARTVFSNLYVANAYFPDFPWELGVKIEYISLYLTMIWAILFLSSLFPQDVNGLFKYFLVGCNLIFVTLTSLTEASLYTQFLPVYLSFVVVLLVYVIYIMIRGVVYERDGVWYIISSILLGVVLFSYDLIAYQGIALYNATIINVGYLIMFLLIGTCLAFHLGLIRKDRRSNILTYEDLYGTSQPSKR